LFEGKSLDDMPYLLPIARNYRETNSGEVHGRRYYDRFFYRIGNWTMKTPLRREATPAPWLGSFAEHSPLCYSIMRLAKAHRALATDLLRSIGLHPGQEILLMILLEDEETPHLYIANLD